MLRLLSLAVLAAAVGCAGKPPPPTPVEVKGRVLDRAGKGVAKKVISLIPAEESNKNGPRLTKVTGEDGSFSGTCWPGKHTASVAPIPLGSPGGMPTGGVAGGDSGPPVSAGTVEVPAGGTTTLEIRTP